MEAAKVFKYSGKEFGASVCFGLFAISWLILRLIIFPFRVIKTSRFASEQNSIFDYIFLYSALSIFLLTVWMVKFPSYDLCDFLKLSEAYDASLYYVFNTMLLTLLVFHIYWGILIYLMIMRQLKNRGKVGEDIRSGNPCTVSRFKWPFFTSMKLFIHFAHAITIWLSLPPEFICIWLDIHNKYREFKLLFNKLYWEIQSRS